MLPPDVRLRRLKCTKFDFGLGYAMDPAGGASSAPTGPVAGFEGPASMGREGMDWEGGKENRGKGRDRKGRKCRVPTPTFE